MNNKVDKLFREKLEGHSLPPSAQAWDKLEARLSKKNRTIIWFRVAAVVGLAGLLTFALLQQKDTAVQAPLAQQKDTVKQKEKDTPAVVLKEKETSAPIEKKHSAVKRNLTPFKTEPQKQEEVITNNKQEENPIAQVADEKTTESTPTVASAPAKKPMKLTFSLPTLETKNEVKEEMTVAAAEEKKTTLQKAADVAHEIRTGEVLGNLREAKNDLFALEFKKDKTKKQQ